MAVNLFSTLVFLFGILPYSLAGNQCGNQFPGKGYCISKTSACPRNSQEFPRLSNGFGCPGMNQRCCVNGGIPVAGDPSSDRSSCGIGSLPLTSRIFNGINAGPCDWPFVVSIRAKLRDPSGLNYASTAHSCAGVLIDKTWVLTSAICVLNAADGTAEDASKNFMVVAGEYNISGIDIDPLTGRQQEQLIPVDRAIIFPGYAYKSLPELDLDNPVLINGNSVALIKLAQPINGHCSGLICLPTLAEAEDSCASYDDCVITGWGFTSESFSPPPGGLDKLKQGRVKLASQKGCDLVVRRLNKGNIRPQGTICQTPANFLTDGCLSDQGGAVMCSTGKNWVVRAILPFQMCSKDKYNLFVTDVAPYLNWIKNTMATYRSG